MRWFHAVAPREQSFFDAFTEHATLLVQGAVALRDLLNGGDAISSPVAAVVRHEAAADEVARRVFLDVRRTFVAPFDRSDIRDLTSALDQMRTTAKSITLYGLVESRPEMWALGDVAIQGRASDVRGDRAVAELCHNADRLNAIADAVIRIESRPDDVYDAGMRGLFKASQDRPMAFIANAEVFDELEKVIDRFEDMANGISGILIERLAPAARS